MTDTRSLLKQALSALLLEATSPPLPTTQAAIDALSAALQAPQIDGFGGNLDEVFDPAPQVEPVACPYGCATQEEHDAHYAAPPAPAVPLPSLDLTWLHTHCRAIGMTEQSDSKKWEHDIALFTTRLQDRIRQLESARPAVPDGMVMVPKTITVEMRRAAAPWIANYHLMRPVDKTNAITDAYTAMMAAAPAQPAVPDDPLSMSRIVSHPCDTNSVVSQKPAIVDDKPAAAPARPAARDCRSCSNYGTGWSEPRCRAVFDPCTNADRYEALPPVRLWRKA